MAISFDAPSFYEKMKNVVVTVSVVLPEGPEPEQEIGSSSKKAKKSRKKEKKRKGNDNTKPEIPEKAMSNKTGGVLLDDIGTILKCSQNIPDGYKGIYVGQFDEVLGRSFPADLIARHEESDLALIRLRRVGGEKFELNYARVGSRAFVGMTAVTISHPHGLLYSFTTGMVAFPCDNGTPDCRTAGGLGELPIEVSKLDPDLPIIQISNLCGGKGSAGAPIFNSQGLIIGIYSFKWESFDWAIHFAALRTFVEAHALHVLRNESLAAVSDDDED